jgi:hypothetical protein
VGRAGDGAGDALNGGSSHPLPLQVAAITDAYRRCRWAGIAVCSTNNCLIAASCIELDEPLLHLDGDFERVPTLEPRLRLAAASSPTCRPRSGAGKAADGSLSGRARISAPPCPGHLPPP